MKSSLKKSGGLREQIEREWRDNIAPFWIKYAPDTEYGGFRGLIANDLRADEHAEKGIILNSRILWTFSQAYSIYRDNDFLEIAERAYIYLIRRFIDYQHGGVFWTVDYKGRPLDRKKRVYAQAFAIYALTEFYLVTRDREALDNAYQIFNVIESRCRDPLYGGYLETFEGDWTLASDQRLSEVDQDEKKSMNTHLHVMEAYTALSYASGETQVKDRLRDVINIFLTRIIHPRDFYLQMFFDETWACKSTHRSFGHDIEASWLLCEAAEVLGEPDTIELVRVVALDMAQSVYENGLDTDGSLFYEADANGVTDTDKHWWAEAEAVVGFVNAYQMSGAEYFLEAAWRVWEFINSHIIDKKNGEWFWKTSRDGTPSPDMPKLSQWKCPYHNGRLAFEIGRRLSIEVSDECGRIEKTRKP
jgi:mannobiose 2-epimerase